MQSNKKNRIKVGISIGEITGIGTEIILKSLAQKEIMEFFTPVIFASTKLLSHHKNFFGLQSLYFQGIFKPQDAIPGKINVVNLWKENVESHFGKPTPLTGKMAFESLTAATKALKEGKIDVLVTAPIDKENIQSNGFNFLGHTEFLEHELGGKSLMLLVGEQIKVALVTQHIPLSEVAKKISKELIIEKAKLLNYTLKRDFCISKPKIAVLGLNPHAGDKGLIGKEEQEIISPAIKTLFDEHHVLAFGPFPADGFFQPQNIRNFDAVLAMYHDQGLIPFKTLEFEIGVNFTAGLNKIRTSPDHGVAYDIAGKNIASFSSFQQAIFKAIEIYKTRKDFEELIQNPLKSYSNMKEFAVEDELPDVSENS